MMFMVCVSVFGAIAVSSWFIHIGGSGDDDKVTISSDMIDMARRPVFR